MYILCLRGILKIQTAKHNRIRPVISVEQRIIASIRTHDSAWQCAMTENKAKYEIKFVALARNCKTSFVAFIVLHSYLTHLFAFFLYQTTVFFEGTQART